MYRCILCGSKVITLTTRFQPMLRNYPCNFPCCRQTRKYMQNWIKPGVKLFDMCERLEETARTLVEANGLSAGKGMSVVEPLNVGRPESGSGLLYNQDTL